MVSESRVKSATGRNGVYRVVCSAFFNAAPSSAWMRSKRAPSHSDFIFSRATAESTISRAWSNSPCARAVRRRGLSRVDTRDAIGNGCSTRFEGGVLESTPAVM